MMPLVETHLIQERNTLAHAGAKTKSCTCVTHRLHTVYVLNNGIISKSTAIIGFSNLAIAKQ